MASALEILPIHKVNINPINAEAKRKIKPKSIASLLKEINIAPINKRIGQQLSKNLLKFC